MHPLLEKLMMAGFMISGLCTGAYFFGMGQEKTIEELLEEDNVEILDTEAKEDSEEYEDWGNLLRKMDQKQKADELNEFLGETMEKDEYEKTVEKLQKKCDELLATKGNRRSRDYRNARLFCTEYDEEEEESFTYF